MTKMSKTKQFRKLIHVGIGGDEMTSEETTCAKHWVPENLVQ